MNRLNFIKKSILATATMTQLGSLYSLLDQDKSNSPKMPVLFVGHGNPMNAIEQNEYHNSWAAIGRQLPRPKAILCVSAHWLTKGTFVTAMEKPRTIHDFGGFPQALFDQQYPAPGSPEFAKITQELLHPTAVGPDYEWGLDHGTWSVLLPMFPRADIPVFQLSLDYYQSAQYHYDLAKSLIKLREKGVLIVASGNIVHNLGMVNFRAQAFDWNLEFDTYIKKAILDKHHQAVINYEQQGRAAKLAVPTPDHYFPLLYALALQDKQDQVSFFNEKYEAGSIAMRSLLIA